MLLVLLPFSLVTLVPSEEHSADCSIARITGHPNLAIVICISRELLVDIKSSTFSFTVSVLMNRIFIAVRMFARVTTGEGLTIRKSTGYFIQKSSCSRLSAPQYQDFHSDPPKKQMDRLDRLDSFSTKGEIDQPVSINGGSFLLATGTIG
jgi:hypothetical protein